MDSKLSGERLLCEGKVVFSLWMARISPAYKIKTGMARIANYTYSSEPTDIPRKVTRSVTCHSGLAAVRPLTWLRGATRGTFEESNEIVAILAYT